MGLTLLVGLGACALALSSGYANYLHVKPYGATIVGLVLAGEVLKFTLPLVIRFHSEARDTAKTLAAVFLLTVVATVSFLNTFGNATTRLAVEQGKLERAQKSATRPEHVIMQEIASLPACKMEKEKGKKAKVEVCPPGRADKVAALKAEIEATRKKDAAKASENESHEYVDGDPVRDGLLATAGLLNIELKKERVFVYIALLWTILAEVGTILGGFIVPTRKP